MINFNCRNRAILTTSSTLTTANTTVQTHINKKITTMTAKQPLTKTDIIKYQKMSQHINNKKINQVLKQSLALTKNQQVIIKQDKLDTIQLPNFIKNHLNLSLSYLNQAITKNYITPVIINNQVQLNYHTQLSTTNNENNAIVTFMNPKSNNAMLTNSSYIWFSFYGPSSWWRFWEWGMLVHFSEQALNNAKIFRIVAEIANVLLIFKNIWEIKNIINSMKSAWIIKNIAVINKLMVQLSLVLGDINLSLLGTIVDILAILTAITIFIIAICTTGAGIAFLELLPIIIIVVINEMENIDNGYGVYWQWVNFIIPCGIYPA